MSARKLTVLVCDMCGNESAPYDGTSSATRVALIRRGWSHPGFAADRCPTCTEVTG
jgi:hypothetical protein